MTHKSIVQTCETLGLMVQPVAATGHRSYDATSPAKPGVRVYWSTSYEGGVLSLPRVIARGHDVHARTVAEIKYLVQSN